MAFHSDNETGIAPDILEALLSVNRGTSMPYGNDPLTETLNQRLSSFFDCPVEAFLVASGTASNCLALSCMTPAFGGIYCHEDAHILVDECGGPEFFTGGARLIPQAGADGKLHVENLQVTLDNQRDDIHYIKPSVVSLTQVTEAGTVYTPEQIKAISALARDKGLYVHMDGTRFANAIASLDCHPADISWKSGVDVLCFGASKNGAIAAEAVVFFNKELAKTFNSRRKRAGHLLSKMRFVSAQFDAYLSDHRWLKYASHANAMAKDLKDQLLAVPDIQLVHPVDANLLFTIMPEKYLSALQEAGYQPDYWDNRDGTAQVRLVTAFNTTDADIEELMSVIHAS